jgi:hypothetical protein
MSNTESNWLKAWNKSSTDILTAFVLALFIVCIFSSLCFKLDYDLAMERLKPSIATTVVVEETILDADGKPVKIIRTTTTTPPEEKP